MRQALNAIRGEIERVDDETKWAALELILVQAAVLYNLLRRWQNQKQIQSYELQLFQRQR